MSIRNFEYVELLEIAVAVGCPNTCLRYCPQEVLNKAYGKGVRVMSFESFKKILSTVPKTVYLDFAGLTEPFINPDFVRMAQYASENGFQFGVKTTLVNATVESIKAVAETKPCCVFIHIPDGTNFVAPDDDMYDCLELFSSESSVDLYCKLERVLQDSGYRKFLGVQGERLRFENRWSIIAGRHFRVYQAVGASNSVTAK